MKTSTLVTGLGVLVCILITGGVYNHQMKQTDRNTAKVQNERVNAEQYEHDYNHFSKNSVRLTFDANNTNLQKIERKFTNKTQRGMDLAFNQSTTKKSFNKNQNKVTSLLGSDVGPKALAMVQPQQNENPIQSTYGKPLSSSAKMEYCHIAYGNYQNNLLPVTVAVKFDTPPFNPFFQFDAHHRKEVHHGYMVYNGNLQGNGHFIFNAEHGTINWESTK